MLRRFYTVMIVPHEGGTLRRISISLNFVVSMASIFLFCFVSSAFLAHFFLDGMHRIDEAERLRVQAQRLDVDNSRMRSELQVMVVKVEDLTTSLERYREAHSSDWPDGSESMGGGFPDDESAILSLDGDWRATSRAAQDKADFWIRQIKEQLCDEEDAARSRPSIWPVDGRVTSRLGFRRDPINGVREFHQGLDIAAAFGTEVDVTADGVVVEARRSGGYGNMVRVDHGDGIETIYGHLKKIMVREGQVLTRGATVGLVGSTGRSTGPHLHYEVRRAGAPVCPLRNGYLPAEGARFAECRPASNRGT